MRLWSLHPKHIDDKGLQTLWREALLAQKTLAGRDKGHRNHPQLVRFNNYFEPLAAIGAYLFFIHEEGRERGAVFGENKIMHRTQRTNIIKITTKQLEYEFEHLKRAVQGRSFIQYNKLKQLTKIEPNPIFEVVEGEIEAWEKR
ncbi:MAG: hypothetical protein KAJ51_00655 [Thermoplasmata archaeon]|nr:hypothetical protein [Thermoplasmata archaeon]